ncbi:MAG: hypothetical protein WCB27_26820, partial [Thermoguttaceae bacterium]
MTKTTGAKTSSVPFPRRSVKENPDFGASYFDFFEDAKVFLRKNRRVLRVVACGKSFFGAEIERVSCFCGKRGRIWVAKKVPVRNCRAARFMRLRLHCTHVEKVVCSVSLHGPLLAYSRLSL